MDRLKILDNERFVFFVRYEVRAFLVMMTK